MVNIIDLNLLAKRESERVEWKENVADVEDIIKTITAFANDYSNLGGGYVVCGAREVKDEYGFPGVTYQGLTAERIKEIKGRVVNACRNFVDPEIVPIVEELLVPGDESKRVLVFIVPASNNAHSYRSKTVPSNYYIRIDSHTMEARNGLYRELLIRKHQLEPWDKRINQNSSIEDLDLLILREYLQEMKLWFPNKSLEDYLSDKEKISDFTPPLTGKKDLDPTLKLKNFAILMFGKKPLEFFDGAYAVFSVYKGSDRSETTAERYEITGTIVQQAKRLIELLNAESYTAFDKTTDTPNQLKYPDRALKEAVINALVHRDYESDQPVRVTIFSDRIEIFSPGGLPLGLDKEKFKTGKASAHWRNQTLSHLFNRLQLAQAEGQGIPTIFKTMKDEGCPPPTFDPEPGSVTCVLPAHPRHQILREIAEIEKKIVLRDYQDANEKLAEILAKDLYNFRALELFCDANVKTPHIVFQFLQSHKLDFDRINPNTLIDIAETLALIPENENKDVAGLAETLLNKAIAGRLEEKQIIKIAYNFKKIGENKKVEEFINRIFLSHPELQKNSSLLQFRARAKIDLAKICQQSALDSKFSKKIKISAMRQFEKYLHEAEKDLYLALENTTGITEKDWLLRDLTYLQEMKRSLPTITTNKSSKSPTIYVDSLPPKIKEDELIMLFSGYGDIDHIDIPSKGAGYYAFIHFKNENSLTGVLRDKDKLFLKGQKINVSAYKKRGVK